MIGGSWRRGSEIVAVLCYWVEGIRLVKGVVGGRENVRMLVCCRRQRIEKNDRVVGWLGEKRFVLAVGGSCGGGGSTWVDSVHKFEVMVLCVPHADIPLDLPVRIRAPGVAHQGSGSSRGADCVAMDLRESWKKGSFVVHQELEG